MRHQVRLRKVSKPHRRLLRAHGQFRDEIGMARSLGRGTALDHVVGDVVEVLDRHCRAIDAFDLIAVHQQQVIGARTATQVDILADLDDTLGPEDR